MLQTIPFDIWTSILNTQIFDKTDLRHLCLVSKLLQERTVARLYYSFDLNVTESEPLQLAELADIIQQVPAKYLAHTRVVRINTSFYYPLYRRCIHRSRGPHRNFQATRLGSNLGEVHGAGTRSPGSAANDQRDHLLRFVHFVGPLNTLLQNVPDNHVITFQWDLGHCLIEDFVKDEPWTRSQQHLEHISLITDSNCGVHRSSSSIDLLGLTKIKTLSWHGLSNVGYYRNLGGFVSEQRLRESSLTKLELGFESFINARGAWLHHPLLTEEESRQETDPAANFFATVVLGITKGDKTVVFDSLKSLKLLGASFHGYAQELTHALNLTHLKSLTLLNCDSTYTLLKALVGVDVQLSLETFILGMDRSSTRSTQTALRLTESGNVFRFIDHLSGLQTIALSLANPMNWSAVMESISRHLRTLKHLVVHGRSQSFWGEWKDMDLMGWANNAFDLGGSKRTLSGVERLLDDTGLDFFGIFCRINRLQYCLKETSSKKPKWKILHFRVSGINSVSDGTGRLQDATSDGPLDEGPSFSIFTNATSHSQAPSLTAPGADEQGGSANDSPIFIRDSSATIRTQKLASRSGGTDLHTTELLHFAEWAFQNDGLPELQIIAYGDFSYNGRYADLNILLVRDDQIGEVEGQGGHAEKYKFRTLRDDDAKYWDMIQANMEMLTVCPSDSLMTID